MAIRRFVPSCPMKTRSRGRGFGLEKVRSPRGGQRADARRRLICSARTVWRRGSDSEGLPPQLHDGFCQGRGGPLTMARSAQCVSGQNQPAGRGLCCIFSGQNTPKSVTNPDRQADRLTKNQWVQRALSRSNARVITRSGA